MANHQQRLVASGLRYGKARPTPTFLRLLLLFLVFFVVASLIFVPRHLFPLGPSEADEERFYESVASCSPLAKGTICCDRSAYRTDVCFMGGDVRTHSPSGSILLLSSSARTSRMQEERIRPYTRKWENGTMATIDELRLRAADGAAVPACDVHHDVPAVVFSNGGFTGNVYHEFNDGLIPLYITSHQFSRRVVFLVVEYHDWWFSRYRDVLSRLSDFPPVDFSKDNRTHCFPQAVVGLKIHDELSINPSLMPGNKSIRDFRRVLDDAYKPRVAAMLREEEEGGSRSNRPKLVLVLRKGSRKLENQRELVELAGDMGFEVEVVWPQVTVELAEIYRALNACDVMVGVHGAAMTHFLFMRPGSVFVQIVPLGTNWAAEAYYGRPARKLGLTYVRYEILPKESSLYRDYEKEHPVLAEPERMTAKGWGVTKKIYLNGQNVNLDLTRFRDTLVRAYEHVVEEKQRKILMQRMYIGGKKKV
ncbi:uncharacterized protein M6B38_185135 [Iris pallida]|uniref:Glycosyltransferase 61 catalytic domain-containing protein n=1 Tax=Iris pallida TaxID=29817 RepID=A0AAX6EL62_IRIPA|nr:uncharacterized protein M6B38_185135 [Iris pallida]